MTEDNAKEKAAFEIQAIVQKIMDLLLKSGLGPESTAFALGVCLSASLEILKKVNPDVSPEAMADRIFKTFLKGFDAQIVPIYTKSKPIN